MAYRSQSGLGAFIRPEYSVLGACDGAGSTGPTGNPKATWMWMKGPGGVTKCYSPDDPAISQQSAPAMWTSAPELPIAKPSLPPPGGAIPLVQSGGAVTGGMSTPLVGLMDWIFDNKLLAAGIAAGVVFLVVKK